MSKNLSCCSNELKKFKKIKKKFATTRNDSACSDIFFLKKKISILNFAKMALTPKLLGLSVPRP